MWNLITIFILFLTLASCVPSAPSKRSSNINPSVDDTNSNLSYNSQDLYWYSGGSNSKTITINGDTQTVIYLKGNHVGHFLETGTNYYQSDGKTINQYCMTINFDQSNSKKQFRVRAMPISYLNFENGKHEKLFRVDLPDKTGNSSTCDGTLYLSGACSNNESQSEAKCQQAGKTWRTGLCSNTSYLSRTTCETNNQTWKDDVDVGKCSDTLYSTKDSCESASASWTIGICDNSIYGTQTSCEANSGTWFVAARKISSSDVAFKPDEVCPDCTNSIIDGTKISIYLSQNGKIKDDSIIQNSALDLAVLGFRLDVKSNSSGSQTGCTNLSCKALNFDCCVNKQCVKDGQLKPNAENESDYQQALQDVDENYYNFVNYPNIYFICTNMVHPTPIPTGSPDPEEEANKLFEQQKFDFGCLEGAKNDPADYTSCCFEGASNCDSATYKCLKGALKSTPDYSGCCSAGDSTCTHDDYLSVLGDANTQKARYETTQNDVWDRCGCEATIATPAPNDPETVCPDFGLKVEYESDEVTIKKVTCDIPIPPADPTPFQDLDVNISGRIAPHRFFQTDGTSVDDVTTLTNSIEPEGTPFYYLDESGKTDPVNGKFNMNSILGQMTVELDSTIHARMIDVEYDQVYIISAVSGMYTPCPQCIKDGWSSSYTAHPPSLSGLGLSSVGYTSTRFTSTTNLSYGNYEDTIFGRACWIPPTMIPFSHHKNSNLQTQRLNRLETQSAYYVNGYQRDWFGFNKGAIIASFDGVSWFAVGDGRRVKANSTKLFLAINAPFADLAEPSTTIVSIVEDLGNNSVADYDYNPELSITDNQQNKGATCQAHHQCEKDYDCITRLGWEYVCTDISKYKSLWPKFDMNANEIENEEISSASFLSPNQILKLFPSGEMKRCVYRGSGAPCKVDYSSDISSSLQKHFTCAPNFYCANIDENEFNSELARSPNQLEIYFIGQEADILGRPKNYLSATNELTESIQNNIKNNAALVSSDTTDFGICLPGKKIDIQGHSTQHSTKDNLKRTDYISQISACDSGETRENRIWSCPVFDDDNDEENESYGNYVLAPADFKDQHRQNSCGKESQNSSGVSVFESMEAGPLHSISILKDPTIVRDGCLRRAGSICHTNLDCTPNILHSDNAKYFGFEYFGGTEAEQKFWQEYLVCGQASQEPTTADSEDYYNYDLTKNRCCRQIGNDVTLFTQGTETIIPDIESENINLRTDRYPYNNPKMDWRYSRYTVVSPLGTQETPGKPFYEVPKIETDTTPKQYQWKTIHDTARKTCCGGGWIRKFADNTHDWTNRSRLSVDFSAFSCINYQSTINFVDDPGSINVNAHNYSKDAGRMCLSPADNNGCIQVKIKGSTTFELTVPSNILTSTGVMDTSLDEDGYQLVNHQSFYQPAVYDNPISMINSEDEILTYFKTRAFDTGVSFHLPIYVGGVENISAVKIRYFDSDGATLDEVDITASRDLSCPTPGTVSVWSNPKINLVESTWCVAKDKSDKYDIFHVHADSSAAGSAWESAGVVLEFNVLGTDKYKYDGVTANLYPEKSGMEPGNALYYLTKLGRLELLGIPQIFYEPIYCNSDKSQLVQNIFDSSISTRTDFDNNSFSYGPTVNGNKSLGQIYDTSTASPGNDTTNPDEKIVFQNKVSIKPVFSGHKIVCCLELGHQTPSSSSCCSNYSVESEGKYYCKLPSGTNLNVYFNRFVSGDGVTKNDSIETPFTDDDFIPETGEPKLATTVYDKIVLFGQTYCSSGNVIKGSSFGDYFAQPNNGTYTQIDIDPENSRYYSIVDSMADVSSDGSLSALRFAEGYRWSHHYYCE